MSGAIQKIDKSILDTARSDLSYAQNMIIILCILTGEVGMPSDKYIDFFYYSVSGQGLGLNRPGDTSKKEFNKALQELLDSGHCIETRGGLQFYEEMFTADRADKERMKQADTFKEVLKEIADKCDKAENNCEQSEDKCATAEDFNRNELDDMRVMQYVKHSLALDVELRGCKGIVVYNADADAGTDSYRVLKGSKLAEDIASGVANGGYCSKLQSDRNSNHDKISNLEVIADVYLPSMTRCLAFLSGGSFGTNDTTVHNSCYNLAYIVGRKNLYAAYIASGKSVAGLGIPEEQQFVQAQAVKPVVTMSQVVSLPVYYYSAGDTLIVKGDGYNGKVEYTGSGWKILAGSICGNNGTNLSEEDGKFLTDLGKAGKVNPGTRLFNSDICVDTFQQAHALLAHQYNETIDTFVCVYWRPPEQPELLTKILGSPDKIRRVFG